MNTEHRRHSASAYSTQTSTRRRFLTKVGAAAAAGALAPRLSPALFAAAPPPKKVAAIVTVYHHNSHADVIASKLLQGFNLDFKEPRPNLQLVSLYMDQIHEKDIGKKLAADNNVRLCDTIADALTLGGDKLAVDAVLLIGEHGKYPLSDIGQILYPRRRFFEETVAVFRRSGRVVPVFSDKHLASNWTDAKWMHDTARELKIPFMAGSSVPGTWRHPALEMKLGARAKEAVALSYGPIEGYAYHGLEALQCLVERRKGGETGVKAVQFVEGAEVWKARDAGRFDETVFVAAAAGREAKGRFKGEFKDAIKPAAFFIEYRDGFRAVMLHDTGSANSEWVVAWSEQGRKEHEATSFWTQEARPFAHFTLLVQGIEKMFHTGKPTWPSERTLLTTGVLHSIFVSRQRGGERIETPHLDVKYQPTFTWKDPGPPAPGRPLQEQ